MVRPKNGFDLTLPFFFLWEPLLKTYFWDKPWHTLKDILKESYLNIVHLEQREDEAFIEFV